HQLTHTRRNGRFLLEIIAHPRFGLPFGQDRLIPVWVATLAVLHGCRTVQFDGPSQLLDYFELPKNGYHYMRLLQGFQRVFAATIFFATEDQQQLATMSTCVRFHFFDHIQIWYNREQCSEPAGTGSANIVTLSEPFYNEIAHHKIPVERRVVAAL